MYSGLLEELLEKHPLQWPNIYPFWGTEVRNRLVGAKNRATARISL